MSSVSVEIDLDDKALASYMEKLCNDGATMLEVNNLLAKMCDPYVPFLEGPLSQTNIVTPEGVTYIQPYARYQYYGEDFNHTLDYHPKASAKWDEAMMAEKGEEFKLQVAEILHRRANEL